MKNEKGSQMGLPQTPIQYARDNYKKAFAEFQAAEEKLLASCYRQIENVFGSFDNYQTKVDFVEGLNASLDSLVCDLIGVKENAKESPQEATANYKSMTSGQKAAYTRKQRTQDQEVIRFDAEKARELRERLGYSRPELARQLKVSPHYIASIELEKTPIGKTTRGKKAKRYMRWYRENS